MKKKRPSYTQEFKQDIVQLISEGRKIAQVSREYAVSASAISTWVKKTQEGAEGVPKGQDAETECRRLRKRLRELEMERDILKKATVWFARRAT